MEQYEKVKSAADIVSYSSKTNPIVTGILEEHTDSMFSIHMKNELKHVRNKERVLFLAQAWSEEDIQELVESGVEWFVVDNLSDLQVLENFLRAYERKVNLLLRIRLKENTLRTEKYFVFGMGSEVVHERLKELRKNNKIGRLGIHFHRKTQNMAEWNLRREFEHMIDRDNFEHIDMVCIGGGLPADYANTHVDVIDSIFSRVREFRDFLSEMNIRMVIEPGRFIAAPSGVLRTEIKRVHENNIVVDASVYNGDMDALIVPVKLKVEGELEKGEGEAFVIKGITPCSLDLFRYRVYLDSKRVSEGEEIVFLNAGAYNFSSDFCDLDILETEIID